MPVALVLVGTMWLLFTAGFVLSLRAFPLQRVTRSGRPENGDMDWPGTVLEVMGCFAGIALAWTQPAVYVFIGLALVIATLLLLAARHNRGVEARRSQHAAQQRGALGRRP